MPQPGEEHCLLLPRTLAPGSEDFSEALNAEQVPTPPLTESGCLPPGCSSLSAPWPPPSATYTHTPAKPDHSCHLAVTTSELPAPHIPLKKSNQLWQLLFSAETHRKLFVKLLFLWTVNAVFSPCTCLQSHRVVSGSFKRYILVEGLSFLSLSLYSFHHKLNSFALHIPPLP